MATISKILALPSATQYNPTGAEVTGVRYFASTYGSSEAPNYFDWDSPTTDWKNKASASYKRVVEVNISIPADTWSTVSDAVLDSSVQFRTTSIGVKHRVRAYTRSNESDVYGFNYFYFYPQTKPYQSPVIFGLSYNQYGTSIQWYPITNDTYWGGAPSDDRKYYARLESMPGNNLVYSTEHSGTTASFSSNLNGSYRWIVYARNKAGDSTFVIGSSSEIFTIAAPDNNSFRCTTFDRNTGKCFSIGSCCPTYAFCNGSACVA